MLADEIRRTIAKAPRTQLGEIGTAMWKAWAAGQVSEQDAAELSQLIETRKTLPPPEKPARRHVGSRPRSAASLERRRSWAAAGNLPPALATRFTLAEQAVLAVVATEVRQKGSCTLTVGHIAGLAGVSETTVRNALRQAKALGLITVEESRRTPWMNHPNTIRIISKEWATWLRLRTGANSCRPRIQIDKKREKGLALTRENMPVRGIPPPSSLDRHRHEAGEPDRGIRQGRGGSQNR